MPRFWYFVFLYWVAGFMRIDWRIFQHTNAGNWQYNANLFCNLLAQLGYVLVVSSVLLLPHISEHVNTWISFHIRFVLFLFISDIDANLCQQIFSPANFTPKVRDNHKNQGIIFPHNTYQDSYSRATMQPLSSYCKSNEHRTISQINFWLQATHVPFYHNQII